MYVFLMSRVVCVGGGGVLSLVRLMPISSNLQLINR